MNNAGSRAPVNFLCRHVDKQSGVAKGGENGLRLRGLCRNDFINGGRRLGEIIGGKTGEGARQIGGVDWLYNLSSKYKRDDQRAEKANQ